MCAYEYGSGWDTSSLQAFWVISTLTTCRAGPGKSSHRMKAHHRGLNLALPVRHKARGKEETHHPGIQS